MSFVDETIIEGKKCSSCGSQFEITDRDIEFYKKVSPVFPLSQPFPPEEKGVGEMGNGKYKLLIPSPSLCPDCRQQRRLSWRNERKLYKRKCDATGKHIISIYSPDTSLKVYEQEFWWSDHWDALEYGREYIFGQDFFTQFGELLGQVPVQALHNKLIENSPYVNECVSCVDSHLVFNSIHSQNSAYSYILRDGDTCYDTGYCDKCFDSYELNECGGNSHKLFYSFKSSKCRNSYFLYNCINCEDCIACTNLVNKKYYICNESYTKEEYEKEKKKLFVEGYDQLEKNYNQLVQKGFRRHMIGYKNEGVFGDNIFFSKNSYCCYDSNHVENCKYIYTAMELDNSYDIYLFGKFLHSSYESVSVGENSSHLLFCLNCSVGCHHLLYCQNMTGSQHCFGCVGLRNKKYCILNKQYTKQEYESLLPKIIVHMKQAKQWGEFFPSSLSPFGYNETVACEYFPLGRKEALEQRYNWSDYEAPQPNVAKLIPASQLPDSIKEIPDDILNWAIECEISGKPFRVIKQELDFYRKHNIPIPKKHPDQRHLDRMNRRNPRKLFERKCDKCGVMIKTTYAPEREETVYCERCYEESIL